MKLSLKWLNCSARIFQNTSISSINNHNQCIRKSHFVYPLQFPHLERMIIPRAQPFRTQFSNNGVRNVQNFKSGAPQTSHYNGQGSLYAMSSKCACPSHVLTTLFNTYNREYMIHVVWFFHGCTLVAIDLR